jgi:hypothetical protein
VGLGTVGSLRAPWIRAMPQVNDDVVGGTRWSLGVDRRKGSIEKYGSRPARTWESNHSRVEIVAIILTTCYC